MVNKMSAGVLQFSYFSAEPGEPWLSGSAISKVWGSMLDCSAILCKVAYSLIMSPQDEVKLKNNVALGALYKKYHKELGAFLSSRYNLDRDTASDIVQDTFLSLTKYISPGVELENERSLIYRIAKNKFIDRCRRDNAVPFISESDVEDFDYAIETPTQERVLLGQEKLEQLESAILRLPPRCQEVFVLRAFEQMSHKQISELCGISKSMVEKHLGKAFALIRKEVDLNESFG